ncbi:peptidase C39 family protein [Thermoproteota archaeon]
MKHYKQTTIYTCAAASLMSVLNHFRPDFEMSRENEFRIWESSAVLPTRGSSLYALALFAKQDDIPVKIVVEQAEYKFPGYRFKSYKKKEIEVANFHSESYYKRAKSAGIDIEERNFDITEVKSLLKRKKIILLRIIIGLIRGTKVNKRNPHYIPVYKYEDGFFYLIDPRRGNIKIQEDLLQEAFDAVHNCRRDNRMIVFG